MLDLAYDQDRRHKECTLNLARENTCKIFTFKIKEMEKTFGWILGSVFVRVERN